MAMEAKTVVLGGSTALAGTGAGVVVQKLSDSSVVEGSPGKPIEKDHSDKNKKLLEEALFTYDESDLACKNKLKQTEIDAVSESTEFKELVVACYKDKRISDRAKAMGLNVIESGTNDTDSEWSEWWESRKSSIPQGYVVEAGKKDWKTASKEMISTCTGGLVNNTITLVSFDGQWTTFLTYCTRDKGNQTVDKVKGLNFWTNKKS